MYESVSFRSDYLEPYGFEERPKGEWLKVACNPYTGEVFLSLKGSSAVYSVGAKVVREVAGKLAQLDGLMGRETDLRDYFALCRGEVDFDDFSACPFCGQQPEYDESSREIVCCGGHSRFSDFADRQDAIRFWNFRGRRRVA